MKKYLKFSLRALVFLLLFAILVLIIAGYWVNHIVQQQTSEHKIELLNWQFPTFESHQLTLQSLEFRYQETYQIEMQGLQITTLDEMLQTATNVFIHSQSSVSNITQVRIENLTIEILQPLNPTPSEQEIQIQPLIKTLQQQLQNLAQSSAHLLIPEKLDIQHLNLILPCPSQMDKTCVVSSKLSGQLNLNANNLIGQLQLKAFDSLLPQLTLDSKLAFTLPLQQTPEFVEFSNSTQIVYPEILNLNITAQTKASANANTLTLRTETQGNFPQTQSLENSQYAFSNQWQTLIDMYHRWSPVPITRSIDHAKLAEQITPFLPAGSFSTQQPAFHLSTQTQIPLKTMLNSSIADLTQSELSTDYTVQINQSVRLPNVASVSGHFKGHLKLKNHQLTGYSIQANAVATDLVKPQWLVEQGWTFDAIAVDLQSEKLFRPTNSVQSNSTQTTSTQAIFKELPFQLNLHTLSRTKTPNSSASLATKGSMTLDQSPNLKLEKAHLTLNHDKLKLNSQTALKNLQTNTDFTAQFTLKNDNINGEILSKTNGDIQINQATASAQLIREQNVLAINALQINQLNVTIPEFENLIDTLSFKAKAITLKADYRNADLELQQFATSLKHLQLQNNQPHGNKLSAQYETNIQTLKHPLLKQQSWQTSGKISSEFKVLDSINAIQSIKMTGELQNASGLRSDYLADFSPKQFHLHWNLADQYFLAGNPIQKTFVDWPKLFSLSSGKLSANGNLTLNPQAFLTQNSSLLDVIKAQTHIEFSGLDGIYNETAFSQLDLTAKLQLEKAQLHTDVTAFRVEQLNHGLIVGPIDVIAQTQTPVENWLATKIILQKAEVGIFEGKAHLGSKIIHLDKEIHGNLHLENVNLQALLLQYPTAELYGTGRLQGELPFYLNLANRSQNKPVLQIAKGEISASQTGGILQYQANSTHLKQIHKSMETLLTVLEDFHYTVLDSEISLDEQQKLRLKLRLEGNNPKVENGRQVNLNIEIEEDLPALITSMQITNQINSTIQQRIQEKLQKERGLRSLQ